MTESALPSYKTCPPRSHILTVTSHAAPPRDPSDDDEDEDEDEEDEDQPNEPAVVREPDEN